MICSRCGDLLLEDRFMDWATRWRCIKCGAVYDSKNVQNHIENEHNRLFTTHSEPEYFDDEVHLGLESFIGDMIRIKNPDCNQRKGRADLLKRAG